MLPSQPPRRGGSPLGGSPGPGVLWAPAQHPAHHLESTKFRLVLILLKLPTDCLYWQIWESCVPGLTVSPVPQLCGAGRVGRLAWSTPAAFCGSGERQSCCVHICHECASCCFSREHEYSRLMTCSGSSSLSHFSLLLENSQKRVFF